MSSLSRWTRSGLMLAVLGAFSATPAQSQVAAGGGAFLEALSFADPAESGIDGISLLMTPVDVSFSPGDWGAISVRGGWARAQVTASDGATDDIAGLTDTQLAVDVFLGQRALLSISTLIPTGKTELDAAQFGLSGVLAAQSLPFSMAAWGTGGRIGADLVYDASPSETTRVTLATGYHIGRAYEPVSIEALQYRPGNQLNARVSVEQYIGRASVSLLLGLQNFGDDQSQGQNLFQAGNRFQAIVSGLMPFGETGSAAVWGGWTRRAEGLAAQGVTPLVDGVLNQPSQDLVQAGAALRFSYGGMVLTPEADVRLFRQADGVGEGLLIGPGITAEIPIRRTRRGMRLYVEPSLRARFGSVEDPGGNSTGIRFFNASIGIRWEPSR